VSDRTVLIVSYALSGFAHLASVGIFVGGTIALIPSRRKDISELGWKALFVGTLATTMIACIAGTFDTGDTSILGAKTAPAAPLTAPDSPKPPSLPSREFKAVCCPSNCQSEAFTQDGKSCSESSKISVSRIQEKPLIIFY
jgi:CNT family concentrative nucleoside transporter